MPETLQTFSIGFEDNEFDENSLSTGGFKISWNQAHCLYMYPAGYWILIFLRLFGIQKYPYYVRHLYLCLSVKKVREKQYQGGNYWRGRGWKCWPL